MQTTNITGDPMVLCTLLIYVSIFRLALGKFPPLWKPGYVDLFRYHVVVFLIGRIVVSYAFARAAKHYGVTMFFLEVSIGFLFAAQLRILDDEKVSRWKIGLFYGIQIVILETTWVWASFGAAEVPILANPARYALMRWSAIVIASVGILSEFTDKERLHGLTRWVFAATFAGLSTIYLASVPWKGF